MEAETEQVTSRMEEIKVSYIAVPDLYTILCMLVPVCTCAHHHVIGGACMLLITMYASFPGTSWDCLWLSVAVLDITLFDIHVHVHYTSIQHVYTYM